MTETNEEVWCTYHDRYTRHIECRTGTHPVECPEGVHSMFDFCPGNCLNEDE